MSYTASGRYLVCSLKFLKEACIVFREHTQVRDMILEVGNTLNTKTESITGIYLRIDTAELKDIRVNHTATEDFHPTGVLTEATTLTATDMA